MLYHIFYFEYYKITVHKFTIAHYEGHISNFKMIKNKIWGQWFFMYENFLYIFDPDPWKYIMIYQ